ncbi:hypothetical protein ACIBBD_18205 [Streptomyces sp. NPDC051315]|uniref:hypothetical protein n=1 Tax=Streptomyces sp. NPDC051315 TaxID=3365650 RepID=UPI0037984010
MPPATSSRKRRRITADHRLLDPFRPARPCEAGVGHLASPPATHSALNGARTFSPATAVRSNRWNLPTSAPERLPMPTTDALGAA